MSVRFAPPSLFGARAVHARNDDWIQDGAHLRVRVSSLLGFPICPFAAWRLRGVEVVPVEPRAVGGAGAANLFDTARPLTLLPPSGLWVYAELDADGFPVILDAITATSGRVLGQRKDKPFAVAGFDLAAVRLSGTGTLLGVRAVERPEVDRGTVDSSADFVFGLPVEDSEWYAQPGGINPPAEAKDRILRGASTRLGPAEVDGPPFPGLSQDADAELVLGHLAPEHLDGWIEAAWKQGAEPPTDLRVIRTRDPDDPVTAELPDGIAASVGFAPAESLLTASADPHIGRYAGLVTTDPTPVPEGGVRPGIWLVASQWAVRTRPGSPLDALLDSVDADELNFGLEREFEPLRDVRERWLSARSREPGEWRTVTLATLACAALEAPFDLPDAFPVAGASWWNPTDRGPWVQRVELPGDPLGVAAFLRTDPEEVLLNPIQDTDFGKRALGLVPQYRRPTGTNAGGSALLDGAVDGDAAGARWEVALADDVGRWGRAEGVDGARPPRPLPSPPGVEATQTAADNLHVRVEVPGPEKQPPGAPEVTEVAVTVDGDPQASQPPPPQTDPPTPLTWDVPLDLGVGEEGARVVVATLVTGEPGPPRTGTRTAKVRDPRVAPAPPTGPELIWTSAGDASGLAELGLQWPAADHARYRVYLGDERVLGAALGIPLDPAKPRAARAAAIVPRAAELGDKALFTQLTAEAILPDPDPGPDRVVRFRHRLPGALRNVQFARVTAVSEHGNVESAFAASGLVPIAVPLTEAPPPPTLRIAPRDDGVRLTVEARGIRQDVLQALAAAGTQKKPQARLRRALGRVAEADTMVAEPPIDLVPPGAPDDAWTATVDLDEAGLPPLARALWVAEVRYPPEPPLEPGANPTPKPGKVVPLAGAPVGPRELNWSAPSLSVSTVHVPPEPPAAITGATATATPMGTRITVSAVPPASARSLGAWSLLVVRHTPTTSEPLPTLDLTGKAAPVIVDDPAQADSYTLALIDPLGRVGKPTEVAVS